jgi:choline-phosphate cytidylyltransferase
VDEVYEGAPWIIIESIYLIYTEFLTDNNIDYVAHDDIPYVTADTEDAYAECKRVGKFIATQRTQGISTSDLVTRIIADRDKYISRNLKRGVSREDLNLSLIEYWIFILKQKYCPRRAVPAKPKKE